MTKAIYVAYYRVSTDRQGQSGLGLDAQRKAVMDHLNGGTLLDSFTEVESGRRNDRPELAKALDLCRRRKATLVIAKLDRLARNVDLVAVDMPQANRLTLHIMAAMAEHEAQAVSQRTKAALQAAKDRGRKAGVVHTVPARRTGVGVREGGDQQQDGGGPVRGQRGAGHTRH